MNNVTIVQEHPKCCCHNCRRKALIDARFYTGPWGHVCVEHWLSKAIDPDSRKVPFLGTGIGQILMTKEQEQFFPDHQRSLRVLQNDYGNDDRYVLLIHGNTVVYTQDRNYDDLETRPPVLRCVFDIATRLLPLESDLQDGGIKIWLAKARGGDW